MTLIANYIPLQGPDSGPNFYEFGDDVLYTINIDNNGDGKPDIAYEFLFTTTDGPNASNYFLYNTGPITTLPSPAWSPTPDVHADRGPVHAVGRTRIKSAWYRLVGSAL